MTQNPVDRFWAQVMPEPNSGCWLWMGTLKAGDYAYFRYEERNVRVHRWAYEQFVGPIPEGLDLDHQCRVRRCVNPDHLRPVTSRQNTLLGIGPTALNARKTHCAHGHEFNEKNTHWFSEKGSVPHRSCRECKRLGWHTRRKPSVEARP